MRGMRRQVSQEQDGDGEPCAGWLVNGRQGHHKHMQASTVVRDVVCKLRMLQKL